MDEEKRKKRHPGRAAIIIAISVIAVLLVGFAGAYSYVKNMLKDSVDTDIPIVERSDEYSVSDLDAPPDVVETMDAPGTDDPELSADTDTEPADDTDTGENTAEDTLPPIAETDPPQTRVPAETAKPDNITPSTPSAPVVKADNYVGKIPIYKVEQKDKSVLNILFVGRDEASYYGRADSAMLLSYNSASKDLKIVSLLRDAYVPIEGHNWNKLGHALAYGGMGLYINTVNYVLDLDVQKYVIADFDGVNHIVETVGGVDIELTEAEVEYMKGLHYTDLVVGLNHLTGEEALAYSRIRYLSGGDFKRAERQRNVVLSVFNKMKADPKSALKTVKTALAYVKTNMTTDEILTLAAQMLASGGVNNVSNAQMPFDGTWSYAYVKPPGYTGNLAVTKIDITANRKALYELLYK